MAQVPFTVSARAARLIGRENVTNAEGALVELVKNCYDADSPLVVLIIENNQIVIMDAGEGMNDQIIREKWMIVGTDDKLNNAITANGRIKSGAKGIGRFALDRLGENCEMLTAPIHNNIGFNWRVNWSDFEGKVGERNKNIGEVFADLEEIEEIDYKQEVLRVIQNTKAIELLSKYPFSNGTTLIIKNLRDEWNNESLDRIHENLKLLTPPEGSNKMLMYMFSDDLSKYGLIKNEDFKDYDYKVVAKYKKNKEHIVNIRVFRNEVDISMVSERLFSLPDMKHFPFDFMTLSKKYYDIHRSFPELLKGFEDNKRLSDTISDFEFTFYFLKNTFSRDDKDKYKYKEFIVNRSAWLKKFGGIKLYRDDFRVRPYGEVNSQAFDWLMLGDRQSQSPAAPSRKGAYRVGSNQVAGIVKISRLDNLYLDDKSNREGLQETETFGLFRNILVGIIRVYEDDRSTLFSNLSELYNILHEDANVINESNEIANEDESQGDAEAQDTTKEKNKKLKQGVKALDRKLRDKNEELAISRAMASAGIMVASFSHEFHKIKNKLNTRADDLRVYINETIDIAKLESVPWRRNPFKILDDMKKQDEKINQWISFSIGLMKKDRRKNKLINIIDYFHDFNAMWLNMFKEKNIEFSFLFDKEDRHNLKLRISELDLDTIFDNLITNSVEAFQRNGAGPQKSIICEVVLNKRKINIRYSDTGPGIPKEYSDINTIFNSFETSKRDDSGNEIGTGLGMWLLKSAVDSNNGRVTLTRPKIGFEINIQFNANNK